MRPAAIDQLHTLGKEIDIPVYSQKDSTNVVELANNARAHARHEGYDTMIFDTAGRLQVDEDLIQELVNCRQILDPDEVLLVADSALGQEAVSVAEHFNNALRISGIVLTKLDGDARGGAALSMRKVTGQPIKFIGVGERIDDLQTFHPDRMADRILGMGDVATLVDSIQDQIDEDEAKKLEERMLKNQFDFNDFLTQLKQVQKLGGMSSILSFLPGGKKLLKGVDLDEGQLKKVEAVILSMTPYERSHPEVMNKRSRRQRVADGAGQPLTEVQQLMKRFDTMRGMMGKMGKMAQNIDENGNIRMAPEKKLSQKEKKKRRKKNKRNKNRKKR